MHINYHKVIVESEEELMRLEQRFRGQTMTEEQAITESLRDA